MKLQFFALIMFGMIVIGLLDLINDFSYKSILINFGLMIISLTLWISIVKLEREYYK